LIRSGNLKLLTKDHSVVARIVESGQITEEQARLHPLRNRLERAVGTDHEVDPDVTSFEIMHGDLMLLCSDGLWGMINDNEIENVINSSVEVDVTRQRLLENALSAGGEDNITLILVEINRK
jgi:protein phosphatase